MSTTPRLRLRGIEKAFAAPVLGGIDLDVAAGEVHALVGGNGAGKSTLCRILVGVLRADRGTLALDGAPYAPSSRAVAERAGVSMVMQERELIQTLSIAENLFFNRLPRRLGFIDRRSLASRAERALAAVGLERLDPDLPVSTLGIGHQQLVEIAAALDRRCRVLILDEPTAALTAPEAATLFAHIRRLRGEGVSVVYVSHRMDEVLEVCDRATVLRDGCLVSTRTTTGLQLSELVREMTGEEPVRAPSLSARRLGAPALRVRELRAPPLVTNVSFTVHAGEILGLAGLIGSGRSETLRAVFGAAPSDGGTIARGDGIALRIRSPEDALRHSIAMVPEDRKRQGLLLTASVALNITLATLARVASRWGWVSRQREMEATQVVVSRLGIRCESLEQPVAELSGGNQQKVLIGRWLLGVHEVVLFDEPTTGVDVASKRAIYALLDEMARGGTAVVVVSSDVRELMQLCDRIVVMSAGRTVAELNPAGWSEALITELSLSGFTEPTAA
ncbi:MAG: sugar ABC transporter ATP-binding protein [Gemmatimonadaceae bacterium]